MHTHRGPDKGSFSHRGSFNCPHKGSFNCPGLGSFCAPSWSADLNKKFQHFHLKILSHTGHSYNSSTIFISFFWKLEFLLKQWANFRPINCFQFWFSDPMQAELVKTLWVLTEQFRNQICYFKRTIMFHWYLAWKRALSKFTADPGQPHLDPSYIPPQQATSL